MDIARPILYDSSLSWDYVVEAIKFAAYIINHKSVRRAYGRLKDPKPAEKGKCETDDCPHEWPTTSMVLSTPYEMVMHESPTIKHLKPFGCTAYVHLDKDKRRSRSHVERAEIGTFLGYTSPTENTYRILLHKTNKVVDSIHCTFDAAEFGRLYSLPNQVSFPDTHVETRSTVATPTEGEMGNLEIVLEEVTVENDANNNDALSDGNDAATAQAENATSPSHPPSPALAPRNRAPPARLTYAGDAHDQHSKVNICYCLAVQVMMAAKEVPVKRALKSPDRAEWITAIEKEMKALEHRFTPIGQDHPEFATAKDTTTRGRYILTRKRDGRFKARGCIQGHLEDPNLDSEAFNYYAHVAKLPSLRALIFRGSRPTDYVIQTCDIATAYLQCENYDPAEPKRYCKMKNPITDSFKLMRVEGPVYGSRSSPVRWETRAARALEQELNFRRGENDASISKLESETLPSISVGEAETRAYANGVHSFIHLSYLASEMQLDPLPTPIIINTDSTVAIAFATNTQLKTRMKHLDVRQHWISMIRDLSIARPIHCSSQNNIADLLTKIHPGPRFQQLVSKLMWTKTYY